MAAYLLDTNVLIEWYTQGPSQKYIAQLIEERTSQLGIAWITAIEFFVKANKKERKSLVDLVETGDLLLYEMQGMETAENVGAFRNETGLKIPDCLVLATAKNFDCILLTRDEELARKGKSVYKKIIHIL